eukprot:6813424-Lingulodinium_polyedra.AAC.1
MQMSLSLRTAAQRCSLKRGRLPLPQRLQPRGLCHWHCRHQSTALGGATGLPRPGASAPAPRP